MSTHDFESVKDVVLGMQVIGDPSIVVDWWPQSESTRSAYSKNVGVGA